MSITVSCQCGKQFKVKDHLAGKAVRCPNCQSPLRIPSSSGESAGKKSSASGSSKIDAEAALLRFEEAQKKKQKSAEEEAAYRAEQNKLIESYDQLTGRAKVAKEGEKEQPKKRITEIAPKKPTIISKLADAVGTILGNLLVKYLLIAGLLGAGAYASVMIVRFMTGGIEEQVAPQVPKEQRRKDLMKQIPQDIAAKKWADADAKLKEIDRLDHKFKTMNRDYQRFRKEVDEALKAGSVGTGKSGGGD